uniref:Uncharacterized protein n=1 Tax=Arundo donax TaxID=35708 RepID=A0A0A9U749_ARUDO
MPNLQRDVTKLCAYAFISHFVSVMHQISPRILKLVKLPSCFKEAIDVSQLISISDNSRRACILPIPSGNSGLLTNKHVNRCRRTILAGNLFILVHLKSKVCKFCSSPSSGSAVIFLALSRRYFN